MSKLNINIIYSEFSFQPNPIIERLHIYVDFDLSDETTSADIWKKESLPKYRKIFKCLKSVNPNIELELIAIKPYHDITVNVSFYDFN
jgi:hypothetical protein